MNAKHYWRAGVFPAPPCLLRPHSRVSHGRGVLEHVQIHKRRKSRTCVRALHQCCGFVDCISVGQNIENNMFPLANFIGTDVLHRIPKITVLPAIFW